MPACWVAMQVKVQRGAGLRRPIALTHLSARNGQTSALLTGNEKKIATTTVPLRATGYPPQQTNTAHDNANPLPRTAI